MRLIPRGCSYYVKDHQKEKKKEENKLSVSERQEAEI